VGIELRRIIENGKFWVAIGEGPDCRHQEEREGRQCLPLLLEIPEDDYNPVCDAACNVLVNQAPQLCPTASTTTSSMKGCLDACQEEKDWGWNLVDCVEEEVYSRSCQWTRRCRSLPVWE